MEEKWKKRGEVGGGTRKRCNGNMFSYSPKQQIGMMMAKIRDSDGTGA